MSAKKNDKIDLEKIKPEEELKYEIASELGYLDKVMSTGWKSLTAKESGRIGGLMSKIRKEQVKKEDSVSKEENSN
ncbi:MAG TPA: small, acid-soluble spore protein, alpha/beta type [Mobilitalea sp.]|nr:small, acid-soluble spore protein, alpha/beta type [Mobilitalea sp.]